MSLRLPALSGLSRRLLRFILLFSLCFTLLAGALQLVLEYRREMAGVESRLELIRSGYLASIERSLWDLNQEQLTVQLRGLVDFPSRRGTREVFLCWEKSEDDIAHWHELDTGYDHREPL